MKKIKISYVVFKILFHITFLVYGLIAVASPILLGNKDIINSVLGIETQISSGSDGATYFNTSYTGVAELKAASREIIEETVAEGAVLLKNDNSALPLAKSSTVNLYGMASVYTVLTGQGSSGAETNITSVSDVASKYGIVSLYEGLTSAGLSVNSELNSWYATQSVNTYMGGSNFMGGATQQSQYIVKDIAWSGLPASASNQATAGIMVLARNSGEATDLYMDTTMEDGQTRVVINQYNEMSDTANSVGDALALSANEKTVLAGMKALKDDGKLSKIIVIMNSASPLMCEFVDDDAYGIDACMWVGTIGTTGATAIGKLLTGDYNPSGRTSDTFWSNSKYNPVYYNYGSLQYGNASSLTAYYSTLSKAGNRYYVAYQEGIYNGYKYTETRYEDVITGRANAGSFDYGTVVSYPFGYGLSYSTFSYSNMQVTENEDDTYTVKVDVTNDSDIAGKEVVQIYLQKPYTTKDIANGVEKASVELIGFTKVYVEGGATVTAEVTVQGKYFAAYDSNVEKTYVIGSTDTKDEYLLTAAKDAHDAVNNILQYKNKDKSEEELTALNSAIVTYADRDNGDAALVWGKYFAYDKTTYSTNAYIESQNANFEASYLGQEANYGVSSITNQFDDVDFQKSGLFSTTDASQQYATRNDWEGTVGKRISLTATAALKAAQKNPEAEPDDVEYPEYGEMGFYAEAGVFDEIKLIYLRGKDYDDPLWDTLLNRMTWEETCNLLQTGLRFTNSVESIAAPSTSQQNGALAPVHSRSYSQLPSQSGFRGFAEGLDPDNKSKLPEIFPCNGIVASTYNTELIERVGEQTGEEAAWAGYNGIYGLGVNIHRGAYCGRAFEYYSEDGFLTGVAAGYEAVGMHKLGVFVLVKHAILNDQETHRAGLNVWANEQSIREIYSRALEIAIEIDREYTENPVLGVMTGMNRIGAKWTGGQGFINTVLRAEYGMTGYAISDYNSSRVYMSPVQGVLNGNDLPDGAPASYASTGGYDKDGNDLRFSAYKEGYGKLAWAMRESAHNILYTVVNSNAMNGVTPETAIKEVTPVWETSLPIVERMSLTLMIWCAVGFAAVFVIVKLAENGVFKKLRAGAIRDASESSENKDG